MKFTHKDWSSELTQTLLTSLQESFESSHVKNPQAAVKKAFATLARPGWPIFLLSDPDKARLATVWATLAQPLTFATDARTLREFSHCAIRSLLDLLPKDIFYRRQASEQSALPSADVVKRVLEKELLLGNADQNTAERVARQVFHQRQQQKKNERPLSPQHALFCNLFSLPQIPIGAIPNSDIRSHLLKQTALLVVLENALPFTSKSMRMALGETLHRQCRPIGFADKFRHVVLLEIESSSAAHDLHYQKTELVNRLRQTPGLENIRDVRFVLKGTDKAAPFSEPTNRD